MRGLLRKTDAIGVQALDAFLKPLIERRALEVASVDANKIAFGGDLPIESSGRLVDAR